MKTKNINSLVDFVQPAVDIWIGNMLEGGKSFAHVRNEIDLCLNFLRTKDMELGRRQLIRDDIVAISKMKDSDFDLI